MPADFTLKQGDSLPVFNDTLKYSSGVVAEPESVEFVMRALTSNEQVALKGESKVLSKAAGTVSYTPNVADSAIPGNYLAYWSAKIATKPMTFPTTGYLWVEVQENLTTAGGAQLVGLGEVKDYLNIPSADRTHDNKLIAQIEGVGALVENVVGPVRIAVHDEWYEGGHVSIALRHAPNYGYGGTPFLKILGCSEYRGPIEYSLLAAPTPTQGTVYSEMVHPELGLINRRTSGGGTYPFWRDPNHPQQSVHVLYASGHEAVPTAVRTAVLETVRAAYEPTMMVGRGFQTVADQQEPQMPLGFYFSRHGLEFLEPLRRPPAFA